MKVGFTGTRFGMTTKQMYAFQDYIRKIPVTHFHHGDCIGADEEVHNFVKKWLGDAVVMHVHPCLISNFRANCAGDVSYRAKDPLMRNRDIVEASHLLIACPKEMEEVKMGSGTWATIRYGRNRGIKVVVILPDGNSTWTEGNDGSRFEGMSA